MNFKEFEAFVLQCIHFKGRCVINIKNKNDKFEIKIIDNDIKEDTIAILFVITLTQRKIIKKCECKTFNDSKREKEFNQLLTLLNTKIEF